MTHYRVTIELNGERVHHYDVESHKKGEELISIISKEGFFKNVDRKLTVYISPSEIKKLSIQHSDEPFETRIQE